MQHDRRRPYRALAAAAAAAAALLLAAAQANSTPAAAGTGPASPAPAAGDITLPPAHAGFDYQIGGPYAPPEGVGVVSRDAQATGLTRVVGLCHSVHWTMHGLAELVGVPYEDVTYRAAGVNHQAWVLEFRHGGTDLYPRLDALIERDPQLRRRTRVDMYRRLGYYPTETSEHSAEYVPWYLHHDGEIARLRLPVDAYLDIVAENVAEYESTRDALAAGRALEAEGTMEYARQIIHSIVTGTPRTVYGNVPNRGLIDNLPSEGVVEVPCLVDGSGVPPTRNGPLPAQLAALNRTYLSTTDLVVHAALEDAPVRVRQAAMTDPATAAALPPERIWELCDAMVEAHGDRLQPGLRKLLGS
ncbi:hypothetical protein [Streptomyces sp. NPDC006925]|uniref:family 4 glycosyl hydrolase n=1 Tax=Streptomyces sp. NPDC006925 TaxID=3364768 RepID=UPI0036C6C962